MTMFEHDNDNDGESGDYDCSHLLFNAKAYLSKVHHDREECLLNELCDIFTTLLTERPTDVTGSFLNLCQVKLRPPMTNEVSSSRQCMDPPTSDVAQVRELFKDLNQETQDDGDDKNPNELGIDIPNLTDDSFAWEKVGVGLSKHESFVIQISTKQLVERNPNICFVRFWGKIFGLERNYYVLECEVNDEDVMLEKENEEDEEEEEDINEVTLVVDKILKPKPVKPSNVPREEEGRGTNKNVYFVCNELGKNWVRLPNVLPVQISSARKIIKFFTGNLDSKVISTPPFPGTEAHYLRAQIARITAGTQVSPMGGYIIDEDDDADDSPEDQQAIINPEFEMPCAKDLLDISNWVHHVKYILPQGRTTWWSGPKIDEAEESEEETNEDPEVGPPLLTPLSEDAILNGIIPWITKPSSTFIPRHSFTSIHSLLWLGAHAYADSRSFENIYIGWGLKSIHNYFVPQNVMTEFHESQEILEVDDPAPQMERIENNEVGETENNEELMESETVEIMQEDELEEDDEDDIQLLII